MRSVGFRSYRFGNIKLNNMPERTAIKRRRVNLFGSLSTVNCFFDLRIATKCQDRFPSEARIILGCWAGRVRAKTLPPTRPRKIKRERKQKAISFAKLRPLITKYFDAFLFAGDRSASGNAVRFAVAIKRENESVISINVPILTPY